MFVCNWFKLDGCLLHFIEHNDGPNNYQVDTGEKAPCNQIKCASSLDYSVLCGLNLKVWQTCLQVSRKQKSSIEINYMIIWQVPSPFKFFLLKNIGYGHVIWHKFALSIYNIKYLKLIYLLFVLTTFCSSKIIFFFSPIKAAKLNKKIRSRWA